MARKPGSPESHRKALGFRCCYGKANEVAVEPPPVYPAIEKTTIESQKLGQLFAQESELKAVAAGPKLFSANNPLLESRQDRKSGAEEITYTEDPILWSPEQGVRLLVVVGKSGKSAWIAAFYVLGDDRYKLATSLIFRDEVGPIALGYEANLRKEILWATAFGVPGEQGAVSYRSDHHAVIVQR
jgi:hypothetical protein